MCNIQLTEYITYLYKIVYKNTSTLSWHLKYIYSTRAPFSWQVEYNYVNYIFLLLKFRENEIAALSHALNYKPLSLVSSKL